MEKTEKQGLYGKRAGVVLSKTASLTRSGGRRGYQGSKERGKGHEEKIVLKFDLSVEEGKSLRNFF